MRVSKTKHELLLNSGPSLCVSYPSSFGATSSSGARASPLHKTTASPLKSYHPSQKVPDSLRNRGLPSCLSQTCSVFDSALIIVENLMKKKEDTDDEQLYEVARLLPVKSFGRLVIDELTTRLAKVQGEVKRESTLEAWKNYMTAANELFRYLLVKRRRGCYFSDHTDWAEITDFCRNETERLKKNTILCALTESCRFSEPIFSDAGEKWEPLVSEQCIRAGGTAELCDFSLAFVEEISKLTHYRKLICALWLYRIVSMIPYATLQNVLRQQTDDVHRIMAYITAKCSLRDRSSKSAILSPFWCSLLHVFHVLGFPLPPKDNLASPLMLIRKNPDVFSGMLRSSYLASARTPFILADHILKRITNNGYLPPKGFNRAAVLEQYMDDIASESCLRNLLTVVIEDLALLQRSLTSIDSIQQRVEHIVADSLVTFRRFQVCQNLLLKTHAPSFVLSTMASGFALSLVQRISTHSIRDKLGERRMCQLYEEFKELLDQALVDRFSESLFQSFNYPASSQSQEFTMEQLLSLIENPDQGTLPQTVQDCLERIVLRWCAIMSRDMLTSCLLDLRQLCLWVRLEPKVLVGALQHYDALPLCERLIDSGRPQLFMPLFELLTARVRKAYKEVHTTVDDSPACKMIRNGELLDNLDFSHHLAYQTNGCAAGYHGSNK